MFYLLLLVLILICFCHVSYANLFNFFFIFREFITLFLIIKKHNFINISIVVHYEYCALNDEMRKNICTHQSTIQL